MEKHKCKLCARTFSNGRALGGHMKGHLTNHPLPPKTTHRQQLSNRTDSPSSSSSSSGDEQEKPLGYVLRENPKKSFRFADPEFSFAGDTGSVIVVQDRESETESRNPTRRRSKRKPKVLLLTSTTTNATTTIDEIKKPKLLMSQPSSIDSPPPTEPEPVSSVSDISPDEDVAMCLMLLSRDAWKKNNVVEPKSRDSVEIELSKNNNKKKKINGKHKRGTRFECPFCCRVFGSGQALGGHKRTHLLHASASSSNNTISGTGSKFEKHLIDLNLPAPLEDDDEFSVVSDA